MILTCMTREQGAVSTRHHVLINHEVIIVTIAPTLATVTAAMLAKYP
jgi:hypothetical protein